GSFAIGLSFNLNPFDHSVFLNGNVTGGHLSVGGDAPLVLGGSANTFAGGLSTGAGPNPIAIFASAASLPASPQSALVANGNGYIGLASPTFTGNLTVQTGFLDRFSKGSTFGTIGFDTLNGASPN